ncbi:MAG: phospholipase D-like domain-containing protein [Eubacteriales bacterium]|nr:phospholipase D-like domain-containing protein [Eubacteriales bacterium]
MKKEYFSIPNLMGYFRILMLPVFLFSYYRAETGEEYGIAFLILAVSLLTDFFDGKIARKFDMVTDFGKILDPVADKLTQGVLAIAVALQYPFMGSFLILFLLKEIYMSAMGLYLIKKKNIRNGAQWYGKICTAVIDVGIAALLLFPELPYKKANIVILVMMAFMFFSLMNYVRFHITAVRGEKGKQPGRKIRWGLLVLAAALYLILGGALPYLKQPEVSETYRQEFDASRFYSDEASCDRAAVIEKNGDALAERIRLIGQAEESVILSTFDFRSDTAGKQMIAALMSAAERGVRVQILMDGFNFLLQMDGNPYFYALAETENVEIRVYNPVNLLTPWKAMSRMHDKYIIADETAYILGGRNTFNYFLGSQKSHKNYDRDVLVYNTGGAESSLYQVMDYFENLWEQDLCSPWNPAGWIAGTASVKNASGELHEIYGNMKAEHSGWFGERDYEKDTLPVNRITLLSNPTHLYSKEPQVFYALGELMSQAKERVVIHTPYIMCNEMMYRTFAQICAGDIPVTLMTNSAENNGNAFGAVDFVLNKEKILDTGLQILEYNGGISYHGKSLVMDDDISIVGSFNMDMKSVYQDTELMLVIHSREVNEALSRNLAAYQEDAQEAELSEDKRKEIYGSEKSIFGKSLRTVIWLLDPLVRFLM